MGFLQSVALVLKNNRKKSTQREFIPAMLIEARGMHMPHSTDFMLDKRILVKSWQ